MKKRIFSLILVFAMLAAFMPVIANAETGIQYGDYLYYSVNSNNTSVTITDCNTSATEIIIPNEINGLPVTCIGAQAFMFCSNLTNITIPNSVTSIETMAFARCSRLTSIVIPDSVTYISSYTFDCCDSLTNIVIPDSVTGIYEGTFYMCSSLTSIVIPNSVTSIGKEAFYNCNSLTNIFIPSSVTRIGDYAFNSCDSLTSIAVDSKNSTYSSDNGVLFNKNKTELIHYPISKADYYTIPDSVTSIGDYAFQACRLTSIVIPNSVTSIGDYAFQACIRLKSIVIPDSVTSIGYFAFWICGLTDVYYGGSEAEWNAINISSMDNDLTNATIHYNSSGIPTPSVLDTTTVTKTGTDYLFDVKLQDVPYGCELITVLYNNGEMTGIKTTNLTSADTEKAVTVTAESADSAKVFIWHSIGSIKSLCDEKSVTIQ